MDSLPIMPQGAMDKAVHHDIAADKCSNARRWPASPPTKHTCRDDGSTYKTSVADGSDHPA